MAVTEVVSIISRSLNAKVPILAVNMDLSKAFDTIDHNILCTKLCKYGIQGNTLRWFISYLKDRTQQVQYNRLISPQKITCGVPQGSNLGPLLFLLYVNDLYRTCVNCDTILYADDCNVFFRINRSDPDIATTINSTLAEISNWFSCNHLALNVSKTNYMVFNGRRRLKVDGVAINNSPLEQVTQSNFLGILIDDCLSWKPHIQITCRKLSRSIGILRKVHSHFSRAIMRRLYSTFVLPYLQYGITLWGAAYKTSLDPLYILQKKALKVALNLPMRTNSISLFRKARVLPLADLFKLYVGVFMFKYSASLLPLCFNNYFTTNNRQHHHDTRSASLFRLPLFSTVNCQQSILFQGPKFWSCLSDNIRQSPTLSCFKRNLKKNLSTRLNETV